MNHLAQNLRLFREGQHATQSEVADSVGISRQALGSYEEGRAEPKLTTLLAIANYYGITLDQLVRLPHPRTALVAPALAGPGGSPQATPNAVETATPTIVRSPADLPPAANVCLVPIAAQAGYALATASEGVLPNQCAYFYLPGLPPGRFLAFEVWGESMEPTLRAGDVVICNRVTEPRQILNHELYTVVWGELATVKRLKKLGGSHLELLADNPRYTPERINFGEVTEIWRVMKVLLHRPPTPQPAQRSSEAQILNRLEQLHQAVRSLRPAFDAHDLS
jgi:transcriptional regulator with XRE-family HTH domain